MEYTIDAKGKRLGRLASEVAVILQGKRDPSYDPKNEGSDRVVIKHYTAVTVSGRKDTQKLYHRHTGYMGHLKTLTFRQAFDRNPKAVIRDAVRRMMPKNFLNQKRLNRLTFTEE